MATQQNEKVVTPIGVSQYAWLTQPDTRFDESGHYKTNLILKTEEAGELMQRIDRALEVSRELAQEKSKGKKVKQADAPYFEEVDDAGNSTGITIFLAMTIFLLISACFVLLNKAIFDHNLSAKY